MFEFFRRLLASENPVSKQFHIADPKGLGDDIRSVTLALSPPDDVSPHTDISLYWSESKKKIFEKRFKNIHEAEEQFIAIERDLEEVAQLTKEYKLDEAKRLVESLSNKYESYSDTIVDIETTPKTLTNASKKQAAKVEFLTQEQDKKDYVKELTEFLNSRFKNQEQMEMQFDFLTAEFAEANNLLWDKEGDTIIFRDKVLRKDYKPKASKIAKVVMQNIFFSNPEEAVEYQEKMKKDQPTKEEPGLLKDKEEFDPEKLDENDSEEDAEEIGPPSVSYEEAEEREADEQKALADRIEEAADMAVDKKISAKVADQFGTKEEELVEALRAVGRTDPEIVNYFHKELKYDEDAVIVFLDQINTGVKDPSLEPYEKSEIVSPPEDLVSPETHDELIDDILNEDDEASKGSDIDKKEPDLEIAKRDSEIEKKAEEPLETSPRPNRGAPQDPGFQPTNFDLPEKSNDMEEDPAISPDEAIDSFQKGDTVYVQSDYETNEEGYEAVYVGEEERRGDIYIIVDHPEEGIQYVRKYRVTKASKKTRVQKKADYNPNLVSDEAKSFYFRLLDYVLISSDPQYDTIVKIKNKIDRIKNKNDREELKKYFESVFGGRHVEQSGKSVWDYYTEASRKAHPKTERELNLIKGELKVLQLTADILDDEEDEVELQPTEDDIVIKDEGQLGSQYGVYFEGKQIAKATEWDDLVSQIKQALEGSNYMPSVFYINDHGNVADVSRDIYKPESREDRPTLVPKETSKKKADEPQREVPVKYKPMKISPKDKRQEVVEPSSENLRTAYSEFKNVQESLNSIESNIREIKNKFEAEIRKYEESAEKSRLMSQMQEYLNKLGALVDATESKNVRIGDRVLSYSQTEKKPHKYPTYSRIMEVLENYPDARKAVQNAENALQKAVTASVEKLLQDYPHKESATKLSKFDSVADVGIDDLLKQAYESLVSAYKFLSLPETPSA